MLVANQRRRKNLRKTHRPIAGHHSQTTFFSDQKILTEKKKMIRNFALRRIATTQRIFGEIRELESFEAYDSIIHNSKTLVYFYANWCGPCKFLNKDIGKIMWE